MKRQQQKPTNRIAKVNSLIQQELGLIIHPYVEELNGLVTISKVETSRDMKWAKVWISILNADDAVVLEVLAKNAYDIQGELNRALAVKIVPRLQFFLDTTPRHAEHIDELIRKIHDEDGPA